MTILLRAHQPEISLNAVTATTDTKGTAFAMPPNLRKPGEGRLVTWEYHFAGATPSACSMQLQGAFNDVDAEYAVLDSSDDVNGAMRHVSPINVRFVRTRQVSRTGGTSVTSQIQTA